MRKTYVVITWNEHVPIQPQLVMDPECAPGTAKEFPTKHHAHVHMHDYAAPTHWYYRIIKLTHK